MAGLLDSLTSDDGSLGVGLLAAGGPVSDPNAAGFGARLANAVNYAQGTRAAGMRNKLLQSQIDENATQDALRKAQLERQSRMDSYFLGGALGGGATAAAPATPAAAGSTPAGGNVPEGAVLKQAVGAPADAPRPPQGKFAEWSQQFNIPVDALVSDYISNGGKGIAEMLFKAGRPDMKESSGGYIYNANTVQPGFLPGITTSADGTSTLRLPDASAPGGVRIQAPQGALDAAGAYAAQKARTNAQFTPGRPVITEGGRMGGQSQLDEINGGPATPTLPGGPLGVRNNNPGNLRPVGASTGFQQFDSPEAGLAALDQNLQAYGKKGINTIAGVVGRWAPSNENNTAAYTAAVSKRLGIPADQPIDLSSPYVRQALGTAIMLQENGTGILTRGGGSQPLIGPGAGRGSTNPVQGGGLEFSPAEKAAQAAEQSRQVDTAKADVVRDTDTQKKAKSATAMIQAADRAIELLKKGPTSSGLGELVDKGANFFGQSSKGAELASQLDIVSGDLVNNVPRMEGPQSDGDRLEYKLQAGRAADRSIPIPQRIAAAEEVKRLQTKYARYNGGDTPATNTGGASGSWAPPAGWTVKVK